MEIRESDLNIISQGAKMDGQFEFSDSTRVHGMIKGSVVSKPGCLFVIAEAGKVEGELSGAEVVIDGTFDGKMEASTYIYLSSTARVQGELKSPRIKIDPGAIFEGTASTSPS